MQSILQKAAICCFTCAVLTSTPVFDTFADEPVPPQESDDAAPAEQAAPASEPEGSGLPADAGEVQERGFGPAQVPQSSLLGPAGINAGTPSLTAIANQLQVTHKSVSVRVDVPGGLSLPVPVEVTAKVVVYGYSSPELKAIYGAGGVHLVHHMPDKPMIPGGGSGALPYKAMVHVTLQETGQAARSFSFPVREITITPLYDINVFNMSFQLVKGCDSWIRGKSDIYFYWKTPAGTRGQEIFKLNGGETRRFPAFDWFTKEKKQADLLEPTFSFTESDALFDLIDPNPMYGQPKQLLQVVPGRHRAEIDLKDARGKGCTARVGYTIHRKLLTF